MIENIISQSVFCKSNDMETKENGHIRASLIRISNTVYYIDH